MEGTGLMILIVNLEEKIQVAPLFVSDTHLAAVDLLWSECKLVPCHYPDL